jgi:hypothetical protein
MIQYDERASFDTSPREFRESHFILADNSYQNTTIFQAPFLPALQNSRDNPLSWSPYATPPLALAICYTRKNSLRSMTGF